MRLSRQTAIGINFKSIWAAKVNRQRFEGKDWLRAFYEEIKGLGLEQLGGGGGDLFIHNLCSILSSSTEEPKVETGWWERVSGEKSRSAWLLRLDVLWSWLLNIWDGD